MGRCEWGVVEIFSFEVKYIINISNPVHSVITSTNLLVLATRYTDNFR